MFSCRHFVNKYKPYNKPDNKLLYINVNSKYPPNIIKNFPESVSWRINKLPSDKTVFNNSKKLFNNAFFSSGFVATNIGKKFLLLSDKHFPKAHKLSKVFNLNNVKVCYSSMPSFASIIHAYNIKVLNENIAKATCTSCN